MTNQTSDGSGRRRGLVTGASRGIGAALAAAAPPDMDLILVGRDAEALDAVKTRLTAQSREVEIVAADLTAPEDRARVIEAADGRIDALVNNAGLGAYGAFLDGEAGRHEATVLLNALAPTLLTHRLLPGMLARAHAGRRRAALINTCSGVAFTPTPSLATYAASKAYLLSLTEAISAELGHEPLDILALCPGPVRSRFGERAGFGRSFPGAMAPETVANRAWGALGRMRTLVIGPVDTPAFSGVALARAVAAEGVWRGSKLLDRFVKR
jgi:short-subunit dehydrogenase